MASKSNTLVEYVKVPIVISKPWNIIKEDVQSIVKGVVISAVGALGSALVLYCIELLKEAQVPAEYGALLAALISILYNVVRILKNERVYMQDKE